MRRLKIVPGVSVGKWNWEVECGVCLLEIDEGQPRQECGRCGATFHMDCYGGLLRTKPICPRCKGDIR